MAIIKPIELQNGVTVNYHRVVSVNNITNISSIIEIASYTSANKRQEEKEAVRTSSPMDVFIATEYMDIPYRETLNVVTAYEYIKTLEKFKGSIDDI